MKVPLLSTQSLKSDHNLTLDLIRIAGILGVVGIHLLYPIYARHDFLGGKGWWVATIIYTASLVSVPLFIMLSGYLLIGKDETLRQIFTRTGKRIVIPLIIWFSIFLKVGFDYFSNWSLPWQEVLTMIASGSMYHLYFLVILMGLYLNLIWLPKWIHHSSLEEQRALLVLFWIAGIGIYVINYLNIVPGAVGNLFTWWLPYMGYFLTGYYIKTTSIKPKFISNLKWLLVVWFIFTVIISYAGIQMKQYHWLTFWHHSGLYYFNTFLSPNIIIASVALFWWWVKNPSLAFPTSRKWVCWGIRELAAASFGVYLVHFLVMKWIDMRFRYAIEFIGTSVWPFIIERSLLVISISFVIALILRRIPIIRVSVGENIP